MKCSILTFYCEFKGPSFKNRSLITNKMSTFILRYIIMHPDI